MSQGFRLQVFIFVLLMALTSLHTAPSRAFAEELTSTQAEAQTASAQAEEEQLATSEQDTNNSQADEKTADTEGKQSTTEAQEDASVQKDTEATTPSQEQTSADEQESADVKKDPQTEARETTETESSTATDAKPDPKAIGKWIRSGRRWWWRYSDGSYPKNEIISIKGSSYGFDGSGWMVSGWKKYGGNWYYFRSSGAMAKGWIKLKGTWYFLNPDGKMATGWLENQGKTYWLRSSGAMATGWAKIKGSWYYFRSSGAMAKGWIKLKGTWYFLNPDGKMATGWIQDKGSWYYLKNSGAMATGWIKLGGTWYYLRSSGAMAKGWIKLGGTWYYLDKDTGAMYASAWTPDGYYCGSSGAYVKGLRKNGDGSISCGYLNTGYGYSGNPKGKKTLSQAFGVDSSSVLAWLTKHEKDNYYLGTPYGGSLPSDRYGSATRPRGRYGQGGSMQCTGFVSDVFERSTSLTRRDLAQGGRIFGGSWGSINALAWIRYAATHSVRYYRFTSVEALLASGVAEKGDLICFGLARETPFSGYDRYGNTAAAHIGFFWGDNPHQDRFWHSGYGARGVVGGRARKLPATNQISIIAPCSYEADVVYLIKL